MKGDFIFCIVIYMYDKFNVFRILILVLVKLVFEKNYRI